MRVPEGTGRGRLCAFGLFLVLLVLVPLAHASPPDPIWIPGIYDCADFDEAVAAVISATALVAGAVIPAVPFSCPGAAIGSAGSSLGAADPRSEFHIRAPPA